MQRHFNIAALIAVMIAVYPQQMSAQGNSANQVFPGINWETWEKPDVVIVHRRAVTDEFAIARNLGKTKVEPPRMSVSDFLKVADVIISARCSGPC